MATGIVYMPYIKELGNLWFVPSLHLALFTRVYQGATGSYPVHYSDEYHLNFFLLGSFSLFLVDLVSSATYFIKFHLSDHPLFKNGYQLIFNL